MGHRRVTWDGMRHPNTIHEVWDFLTLQLRGVKERLRNITDEYYGKEERIGYLCNINEALQVAMNNQKTLSKVGNYQELEELLKVPISECIRPRLLQKAKDLLKPFHDRTKIVMGKLSEAKDIFKVDILKHLETYCSSYVKLGIADDQFYRSLQSKTVRIRGILKQFEKISLGLKQCVAVSTEYFCDWDFSQELSIQFNCDVFPLLRIVPDLLQKLETVIDTAQDWLRSDKVYLDQIQKEIEKVQRRIKDAEGQMQLGKLEYDRIFSLVKQKQIETEENEETNDFTWKSISKLEAKKTRLEIEISAVAKTLLGCRTQLRDLSSVERPHSSSDHVDGEDSEGLSDIEVRASLSHSSYKSRLCRDARAHNTKLEYLRRKKKQIENRIIEKRALLEEIENREAEVHKLNRKLKQTGRRKSKCGEELSALKGLFEALEQALRRRLRPSSHMSAPNSANNKYQVRPSHGIWRGSGRAKHGKNNIDKSAKELHKAFQFIKNNIGFNWKDLARMLPYGPDKQLTEIDNEIKVIEYENQGQLKEQAYQSLLRWYNQCGRRASVDLLNGALRDINENRLADSIEKEVCDNNDNAHDEQKGS